MAGTVSSQQKATKWVANTASPENASAYAKVRNVKLLYDNYLNHWRPSIERAVRNARMYWHLDFGMWPKEIVDKLRGEGRLPPTIPVIPDKVETFVGSILSNGFDINYLAKDPRYDDMARVLQQMYYSDGDNPLLGWGLSKTTAILDSLIYRGYERMKITYDDSPFGSIMYESINPRHVLLNPGYKTGNLADLHDYICFNDLTAAQIVSMYPNASDRLKDQMEREKITGVDYGLYEGAVPVTRSFEEKWATSLHRVIELHRVETKKEVAPYDTINDMFFPDSGFERGTEQDDAAMQAYMSAAGITPDDVAFLERTTKVKFIEAVCPSMSGETILSAGKDIIQTGTVNLFPLGIEYNGDPQGLVVDRLYDIQVGINKGEMNIQDVQLRSAKGAFIMDKALTGGDERLQEEIEQLWNDPAARMWVDEYSTKNLPNGGIIKLPGDAPGNDIFMNQNRYYNMANDYSKVPPALSGQQEYSKESSKLFKAKIEASIIGQKHYMDCFERHEKNKALAYSRQAKLTYSGVRRNFLSMETGSVVSVNSTVYDQDAGAAYIENDIALLPEMAVSTTPSPEGISSRNNMKQELGEWVALMLSPEDRLGRLVLQHQMFSLGDFSRDVREELNIAFELMKRDAFYQLTLSLKNSEQQMQQLMAPPPPQPGAPGLPPDAAPQIGMEQPPATEQLPPEGVPAEGAPVEDIPVQPQI